MERVILHCDLNSFYCSVEILYDLKLKNQPVAVCGDVEKRHGIILAKNDVAKKFNIKTTDTVYEALNKCPNLILKQSNLKLYLTYSKKVKAIYQDYSDKIESFGIDEAWLDVSDCLSNYNNAFELAYEIKERIKFELGLTVSIGISYNKIFAKLGSDIANKNEIYTINQNDLKTKVFPLPVGSLLYVGKSTEKKLDLFNIRTIGDLATTNREFINKHLGKNGDLIWIFANGLESSSVKKSDESTIIKSVGNSTTATIDITNIEDLKIILMPLCESVASRLKDIDCMANCITISLKNSNFESLSKQTTLDYSTDISKDIFKVALQLCRQSTNFSSSIRAVGVKCSKLINTNNYQQTCLFSEYNDKDKKLDVAIDQIRRRFGHYKIGLAITSVNSELGHFSPKDDHTIYPTSYFIGGSK